MAESPDATVRIAYNGNWYAKLTSAAAVAAGLFVVSGNGYCSYAARRWAKTVNRQAGSRRSTCHICIRLAS